MSKKLCLNKSTPYCLCKCDDGYFLIDYDGYILDSDNLINIGKNLINFANKHRDDIINHNKERDKLMKHLNGLFCTISVKQLLNNEKISQ